MRPDVEQPKTEAGLMAQRPPLSAGLEQQAWDHFSAQYHGAMREELEYYPKLEAAWNEWKTAWALATGYEREACAKVCEEQEVHDIGHPGTAFKVQGACIDAIRARSSDQNQGPR